MSLNLQGQIAGETIVEFKTEVNRLIFQTDKKLYAGFNLILKANIEPGNQHLGEIVRYNINFISDSVISVRTNIANVRLYYLLRQKCLIELDSKTKQPLNYGRTNVRDSAGYALWDSEFLDSKNTVHSHHRSRYDNAHRLIEAYFFTEESQHLNLFNYVDDQTTILSSFQIFGEDTVLQYKFRDYYTKFAGQNTIIDSTTIEIYNDKIPTVTTGIFIKKYEYFKPMMPKEIVKMTYSLDSDQWLEKSILLVQYRRKK
jgi:hypothetical protein